MHPLKKWLGPSGASIINAQMNFSPKSVFLVLLIVSASLPFAQAQSSGVQGAAAAQIRKLEMTADYASGVLAKGQTALKKQDYESAFAYFKSACDMLPGGGDATVALRQRAIDGFSDAAVRLARQRISEGRIDDAKSVVAVVLDPRYNPGCAAALDLDAQLKDKTSFFSQTMTPGFVANVEEVNHLLQQAKGFYDSGRYDLAFKRYEQVLNVDKYNIAARRGMEQVDVARQKYQGAAYNEARSDMVRQINKAWELPVKKFDTGQTTIIEQPQIKIAGTSSINRKLDEIIVSKIDFNEASVREALDFLKARAATLDVGEPDPARKGINIVLRLPPEAAEAAQKVTLTLNDIPLRQAIGYVAGVANLKFKVEPHAVVVVPQSVSIDVLITKEYKVPPGLFTSAAAGTGAAAPVPNVAQGSQPAIAGRAGAKEFLETKGGVTFPPGASATYNKSTSRLIVKNTQGNLDLVDILIDNEDNGAPVQVEIEAKFLEITQNNLKELGVDWLLGQFALPFGTGVYGGGGTQIGGANLTGTTTDSSGTATGNTAFPIMNPGSAVPVGASSLTSGPLTGGNRSGSGNGLNRAISVNAVDALLFGTPAGPAPGILALAGVFTNPQFQVVLRALNQNKGVDLVTAPKVTTKMGQKATVEIVREFIYPSQYDLPQVSSTRGNAYTPVTPTSPTAFQMKPVGVMLEVDPQIGQDKYTIDLTLVPRVVEFDGFINYGSPIYANVAYTLLAGSYSGRILATANVINQPVFSTREVSTQVSVYDGQTVVLGGLMREDVQKVQDKVPILGDIPLAGRLFRTSSEQHLKRNLIMFVTASLIDQAGQPLIKGDEEVQGVIKSELVPDATAVKNETMPGDALSVPLPQ